MNKNSKYYLKQTTGIEFNQYLQSDETPYSEKILIKFFLNDKCLKGYHIKTGLNIDIDKFNDGEICFTNLASFDIWYIFANMVAIITIPDDAKVYCDVLKANADKILISERMTFPQFFETIKKEMWIELIKENGLMLKFVPIDLRIVELCEIAVKQNGLALEYVPINLRTKELCTSAVKKHGYALSHIPQELRTNELCEIAVKQNGLALEDIPQELRTNELCEIAVKQKGLALEHVPQELITNEMCEIAVKQNGLALEHVPQELITNEMCEIAVKQNGFAFEYIPQEMKYVK